MKKISLFLICLFSLTFVFSESLSNGYLSYQIPYNFTLMEVDDDHVICCPYDMIFSVDYKQQDTCLIAISVGIDKSNSEPNHQTELLSKATESSLKEFENNRRIQLSKDLDIIEWKGISFDRVGGYSAVHYKFKYADDDSKPFMCDLYQIRDGQYFTEISACYYEENTNNSLKTLYELLESLSFSTLQSSKSFNSYYVTIPVSNTSLKWIENKPSWKTSRNSTATTYETQSISSDGTVYGTIKIFSFSQSIPQKYTSQIIKQLSDGFVSSYKNSAWSVRFTRNQLLGNTSKLEFNYYVPETASTAHGYGLVKQLNSKTVLLMVTETIEGDTKNARDIIEASGY